MRIAVLLSTFNGERFLREQLDSIVNQNVPFIDIHVRDDGSSDNTVNILKEYLKMNKIKSLSIGHNLGYSKSFGEIINNITNDYDFYSFSDQDDFWLPNKLITGIKILESTGSSLYVSSLDFVDKNLRFIFRKKFNNKLTFSSLFSRSSFAGCTFIFDKKVLNDLKNYNFTYLINYDSYLILLASFLAFKIYNDLDSNILHRIHDNNVTISNQNSFKKIEKRFKEIKTSSIIRTNIMLLFVDIFRCYSSTLNYKFLLLYGNYKFNLLSKLKLIFSSSINTNIFIIDLINRLLVLFNLY